MRLAWERHFILGCATPREARGERDEAVASRPYSSVSDARPRQASRLPSFTKPWHARRSPSAHGRTGSTRKLRTRVAGLARRSPCPYRRRRFTAIRRSPTVEFAYNLSLRWTDLGVYTVNHNGGASSSIESICLVEDLSRIQLRYFLRSPTGSQVIARAI